MNHWRSFENKIKKQYDVILSVASFRATWATYQSQPPKNKKKNPPRKKFYIFSGKEFSCSDIKKILIFSQRKAFLIFSQMKLCTFHPKLEK